MTDFTPGELEVMQILWQHGELKPAEIEAHLERPISNAALRSVLRVLMEKGHLNRHKVGKAYYYRPKKRAQTAFKSMTRGLADLFCQGSSFDLIARLINSEKLSEADVRELQRLAEQKVSRKTQRGCDDG